MICAFECIGFDIDIRRAKAGLGKFLKHCDSLYQCISILQEFQTAFWQKPNKNVNIVL